MLDKKTYLSLKKDIRCCCRNNIKQLCDDMELNDFERKLLCKFYDGDMVDKVCLELCISKPTYTKCMKILFSKIYDYKNTH